MRLNPHANIQGTRLNPRANRTKAFGLGFSPEGLCSLRAGVQPRTQCGSMITFFQPPE
jgi:hypothetical protein